VDKEVIKEIKIVPSFEMFEVTAYTSGFESTGKNPMDSEFGITASGLRVIEHYTIACPESLEFGTKIYIPAFENVFTCMDRGSAITEGKLDVYMENLEYALMFGRQHLEVFILP
jgi:3D (Asp-Asp-Asp) domain-containing protein